MRRADIRSTIGRTSDHDGHIDESAGHVTDAARVVDNLVIGDIGETPEHQLHHRAQTEHRRADTHADKSGFADRRIDHALVTVPLPKTFGDFVGAVVLGDLFSKDEHVLIALNFFGQGVFSALHGK